MSYNRNPQFPWLSRMTDYQLNLEMHYAGTQILRILEQLKIDWYQFRLNQRTIEYKRLSDDMVERFDYYMATVAEKEYRKIP